MNNLINTQFSLLWYTSPLAEEADGAWPWWVNWLIILLVIVLFVALWWWLNRSKKRENLPGQPVLRSSQATVAEIKPSVPEVPAPVVPPILEVPPSVTPPVPDDLTILEGIGPKISSLLQAAGITTFAGLADADLGRIEQILKDAGLRLADPTTWSNQARLAAEGKWDELKALTDNLKGGRRVS